MNSPESLSPARDASPALAVTVFAMATLAETRDSDTGNHLVRVQNYVQTLARALTPHPRFTAVLTDAYLAQLLQATPLYDMGTVGIPDRILLKPSRLTAAEYNIMKTHTTLARDAIESAEKALGCTDDPFLHAVKELAYSHQEKWDGSGYPQGLAQDAIPVSARLIAIADVYDALISHKVYKDGVSHEQAVGIIFQGRGSHFDPDMVDAFIEIQEEFADIAKRYSDTDQDMQKKMEYMANAIAEFAEL